MFFLSPPSTIQFGKHNDNNLKDNLFFLSRNNAPHRTKYPNQDKPEKTKNKKQNSKLKSYH